MATSPTQPATPAPTSPRAGGLVPGNVAADQVWRPLTFRRPGYPNGEATAVGFIGDTGAGKTEAAKKFIDRYLQKSPGQVIVVDDKELQPRYDGQCRIDRADLIANPLDPGGSRVLVIRGQPDKGIEADNEDAARLAWEIAIGKKRPVLIVFDELNRESLVKGSQFRKGVVMVPKTLTQGRAPGISCAWLTQAPQDAPREMYQADAICCFKTGGLAITRLREKDYLRGDPSPDTVIPKLHARRDDPHLRGDFTLLWKGDDWDRRIYKFAL